MEEEREEEMEEEGEEEGALSSSPSSWRQVSAWIPHCMN